MNLSSKKSLRINYSNLPSGLLFNLCTCPKRQWLASTSLRHLNSWTCSRDSSSAGGTESKKPQDYNFVISKFIISICSGKVHTKIILMMFFLYKYQLFWVVKSGCWNVQGNCPPASTSSSTHWSCTHNMRKHLRFLLLLFFWKRNLKRTWPPLNEVFCTSQLHGVFIAN